MAQRIALVAEDEALIRMLIADVLDELDFQILETESGQKALELLQEKPEITLLLTDIGLPGMDGKTLAQAARALRPGLAILLATGQSESSELKAFCNGIRAGVVSKPFDLDGLAARIRELSAS